VIDQVPRSISVLKYVVNKTYFVDNNQQPVRNVFFLVLYCFVVKRFHNSLLQKRLFQMNWIVKEFKCWLLKQKRLGFFRLIKLFFVRDVKILCFSDAMEQIETLFEDSTLGNN
jgi:hypothetical protein